MPFFPDGTEADQHYTEDELAIMNRRFDELVQDIEPVNPDEGQTEETRNEEIQSLADDIRSEMDSADEEAKAFVEYLHSCESEDTYFDDINQESYKFYGFGAVFRDGNSEYAVLSEDEIEDAFKACVRELADETIVHSMPEDSRRYFDYEAYTSDVEAGDGWGIMSSYDGNYEEITINEKAYYIFRLN